MKTKQEIAEFVTKCVDKYCIPMVCYARNEEKFKNKLWEYTWEPMELFENDKEFDNSITKLATLFACKKQDILDANENAVLDVYNQYPYFRLFEQWQKVKPVSRSSTNIDENDTAKIKNEIKEKIKQINIACGTNDFIIDTSKISQIICIDKRLITYKQIGELTYEYIKVYRRYSELFFKSIEHNLTDLEIHEFNILSAHFVAMDKVCMSKYISYDYIKQIRPILKSENYEHLAQYIKVRKFEPWIAKEFCENIDMVKRYIESYPKAKQELRDFIYLLKNKRYVFMYQSNPVSISIEKSLDEIRDIIPYIEKLNDLSLSSRIRGIKTIWYELPEDEEHQRLEHRLNLFEKVGLSVHE